MKKIAIILISLSLFIGNTSFASARKGRAHKLIQQGGNWQKLGERKVNMAGDHDEILVTGAKGAYTKLKFKVLKAPIHVHNVKVVFANGESRNFKINHKFAPGTESRVLDLPGNKRIIKKINLNYKTVPNGNGKAIVVVWGRH